MGMDEHDEGGDMGACHNRMQPYVHILFVPLLRQRHSHAPEQFQQTACGRARRTNFDSDHYLPADLAIQMATGELLVIDDAY